MTAYLDFAATTPVDPRVAEQVMHYMTVEFGNAGSRTHEYGTRAKKAVARAREQVASVVGVSPEEVIFTSGATEANNLAILGLKEYGLKTGKKHIVTTAIEHKAVLEPVEHLRSQGFETTLVRPTASGWVEPRAIMDAVRSDTLIVSVMHVNNETGVIQPIADIAEHLSDHGAYLHTDAAQGFAKELDQLRHSRIDLFSVSGHKLFAPKGVGALITRRRGFRRPPLTPLMFGGGHERSLRPGTLPVPLIAGLGIACKLALDEQKDRQAKCAAYKEDLLAALSPLSPQCNGDQLRTVSHMLNVSFPGIDSEAAIVALKGVAAISNGSACTSQNYEPSHVLTAMSMDEERLDSAVRMSWGLPIPEWVPRELAEGMRELTR